MPAATGLLYRNGDFVEATIDFDGERILAVTDGIENDTEFRGIILPKMVNCHTHLGDAAIPKPEKGGTIEEIVAPPDGYKHRELRKLAPHRLEAGIATALRDMAARGISQALDFREGGVSGVASMRRAAESAGAENGSAAKPIILGRPAHPGYDENEINELLSIADGIGLSSILDYDEAVIEDIVGAARGAGKPLALHVSERVREDIEAVLGLGPAFIVHMIKASESDLLACADSGVPVVVCPRANDFFGHRPPFEKMVAAGVDVRLGTDNAMLAVPDMLEEMRFVRTMVSPSVMSSKDIVRAVFNGGGKVLNSVLDCGGEAGGMSGFFVLDKPLSDPFSQVVNASVSDMRLIWPG